jgi:hypothetical protein
MKARTFIIGFTSTIALLALAAANASAHRFILGVGTHFIDSPTVQPRLLNLTRNVEANSVRADTGWRFVETTKGAYRIPPPWDQFVNNARRRGIEPLLILDYGNRFYDDGRIPRSPDAIDGFIRFATFVVKHFAGRVRYYEIWNEWNTGTGGYYPGGRPEDYARLFDAAYPAIKRIEPNSIVLVGGAGAGADDWYQQIARLGVAALADGIAVHPYVWTRVNHHSATGSNGPERSVQQVINIETSMQRLSGGRQIPLYITEIGWPVGTARGEYPSEEVAAMAERSMLMFAALPYLRGVWWYDLIDDGPDAANPEDRFGLFSQSGAISPAGETIRSIASLLKSGHLTWNSVSNRRSGLVVLDNGTSEAIAWQVRPLIGSKAHSMQAYTISCHRTQPRFRITHGAIGSGENLSPIPSAITYSPDQCRHTPLTA